MATKRKKFTIYYWTQFGFAIKEKFAKSIDDLTLTEKVKRGLDSITEFEFCPIQKKYIETEEYDYETIDVKPNLNANQSIY